MKTHVRGIFLERHRYYTLIFQLYHVLRSTNKTRYEQLYHLLNDKKATNNFATKNFHERVSVAFDTRIIACRHTYLRRTKDNGINRTLSFEEHRNDLLSIF